MLVWKDGEVGVEEAHAVPLMCALNDIDSEPGPMTDFIIFCTQTAEEGVPGQTSED